VPDSILRTASRYLATRIADLSKRKFNAPESSPVKNVFPYGSQWGIDTDQRMVRYFRIITRGTVRYFRTVTSVAHFRVIASEVAFGVDFLAISLETSRCAQQLTKLFMFLYQKGSVCCFHPVQDDLFSGRSFAIQEEGDGCSNFHRSRDLGHHSGGFRDTTKG
jgi:hypothetical protein